MKLSVFCIAGLLSFALAGAFAQSADNADSYRKAGAAYFKAGKFREAAQAYQQVIRLRPNDAAAYDQMGEAFSRLGMNEEAAAAFEKEADLLSGKGAPPSPVPAVTPIAQNRAPAPPPQAPAANGQLTYKVGQRVEYVEDGKWFKAIITEVRDDRANQLDGRLYAPYRIHSLGYKDLGGHWACCADFADRRSQLRPAGSGPTEPVPGGEANDPVLSALRGTTPPKPTQPAAQLYNCEIGNSIKITGSATYSGGTYTFNSGSSTLTFHGGDYDGQRAVYEMSYGVAQLHILGPSGRPVIDCD